MVSPARIPFSMATNELTELRKKLNDPLEAGLIKPSKASYGAPFFISKEAGW